MSGCGVVGQHGRVKAKNPMSRAPAGSPGRLRLEIEALLRPHRDSGLSLLAFGQQYHLTYPTFWRWRRRLAALHGPAAKADPRIRRPSVSFRNHPADPSCIGRGAASRGSVTGMAGAMRQTSGGRDQTG